jgi:hypothetical protein
MRKCIAVHINYQVVDASAISPDVGSPLWRIGTIRFGCWIYFATRLISSTRRLPSLLLIYTINSRDREASSSATLS